MVNILNVSKAYSEVYEFINALGNEYKSKIPEKIYIAIKENRDESYIPKYDINQEVNETTFSKEAISLIAILNLKYWCSDVEEKERLKKIYIENTKKEEEKYSYENLFKNDEKENIDINQEIKEEKKEIVIYKENIFEKIINTIKELLKKIIKK